MNKVKWMIGVVLLAGSLSVHAQVTGNIEITLTAEQFAQVKLAVDAHNALHGTSLSVVQWAQEVSTKAIVAEARDATKTAWRDVQRYGADLTAQERAALFARIKAIKEAQQAAPEPEP